MNDTTRLDGAVALVTGANGDIGSAIAELLEMRGAQVVRSDLRRPEGVEGLFIELDVTSQASWAGALAEIERACGHLDILVNNAGIAIMERIDAMSLDDWRRCQQVNVEGMFLGLKTSCDLLARSGPRRPGGAAIVNLCSGASDRPAAFSATYSAITGTMTVEALREGLAGGNPMGRFVEPAEVAEAVAFLASPAARYVHGDAIHVDGGYAAS